MTQYIPVYRDTDEFKEIQKKFPHNEIMFIEKVDNYVTRDAFEKCELEEYTTMMFHGTSVKVQESIIDNGFKKEFSKRAAYGLGNYFSPQSSTSLGYTTPEFCYITLFLNRVKLGKFGVNHSGNNYDIFVLFENCQSLPVYRIGIESTKCKSII